jgi:hypothetical protein
VTRSHALANALGALALACACSSEETPAQNAGGSSASAGSGGSAASGGTASTDASSGAGGTAGGVSDAAFERPPYTPQPGSCGFPTPAFCDTFENGPVNGGRSGELETARWSVMRGGPWSPPNLGDGYSIGPTLLPACRGDLPARVLPDSDVLICDPVPAVPTRHLLTTAAAQNYGLATYRIRQPFDFRGRTGTIKLDVDLTNNGLGGWPALAITEDPSPAPSFDWEERGSGPRNGVSIEFSSGWCNNKQTVVPTLFSFHDYVQTANRPSFDCETPHATTAPESLNHVEVYLTAHHLEVWASDASPDGVNFPNFHLLFAADIDLPFERGYVNLIVRNHATMKYWLGSAATVRWDNVGFDGPVVTNVREHGVPDSLVATHGLDGCLVDGACHWRGELIPQHPGDDTVCRPEVSCKYEEGEGRTVGYVVPRDDETPVKLTIPGVNLDGATRARLVLAAAYPWFDWNGVSKPPTAIVLQYRLNGGAFHDRPIDAVEANAFSDFSPDLGGAGHGSGLLNQVIDLDLSELKNGDNLLELRTSGTWTGEYRAGVMAVDLVLTLAE